MPTAQISMDAIKFLQKNKKYSDEIKKKIRKCLEENLLVAIRECNKHELEGGLKGFWRLHVGRHHVVIYEIAGQKPNRYAQIHLIMTEEKYHNWLNA